MDACGTGGGEGGGQMEKVGGESERGWDWEARVRRDGRKWEARVRGERL